MTIIYQMFLSFEYIGGGGRGVTIDTGGGEGGGLGISRIRKIL